MIEVVAQLKNLRMSPKKVRLIGDSIRGMDVNGALLQLKYARKNAAPIVAQLLRSAAANALHNKEITADKLMVKQVFVNEGLVIKRWQPAAHGSAHPFKKRGSHVKIILTLKPGVTIEGKKEKKRAVKKSESPAPKKSEVKKKGEPTSATVQKKDSKAMSVKKPSRKKTA